MTVAAKLQPAHLYRPDAQPTDRDALCGGRWVKQDGRGLRVWVPDELDELPALWSTIAESLAAEEPSDPEPKRIICHCGCLLFSETETCPACLVWAENAAWMASWRVDYYRPQTEQQAQKGAA